MIIDQSQRSQNLFIMIMTTAKQPNVKLIPSDPTTSTILVIYCLSPNGTSIPYKSIWRKHNLKKNRVEQIKNHNGSSYRCSPLDIDCIIQATVFFNHQNLQISKQLQSNTVKLSRELKQRKITKEPLPCRISLDQTAIDITVLATQGNLILIPKIPNITPFVVSSTDILPETDFTLNTFRVYFKNRFQEFLNYFSRLLGGRPQIKSQFLAMAFTSDIARDTILLGIVQNTQLFPPNIPIPQNVTKLNPFRFQTFNLHSAQQRIKTQMRPFDNPPTMLNHNKNKSESSLSPAHSNRSRTKLVPDKTHLKTSFSNLNKQKKSESLHNNSANPPKAVTDKSKNRQYLNVFEEEEEAKQDQSATVSKPNAVNTTQDQPSINLRGSFQQLQRSFSNVNEQAVQKALGLDRKSAKKFQQQIDRLKRENEQLKKQVQTVAALTKQNSTIKKKYHELKQQINRLQMQRKVILTDKLRCEVNWHKEVQEKQVYKKYSEYLRDLLKNSANNSFSHQRNPKNNLSHQYISTERQPDNRDRTRSPNSSFYNR